MSSAKWWPFCLGLNVLTFIWGHFLERCLHYKSLKLAWQLLQNFHSGFPCANGLSITGPCQFLRFYLMSSSHLRLSVICHGFISHWGWLTGDLFFQSEPYLTGFTFPALSFASTFPFQAQQLWTMDGSIPPFVVAATQNTDLHWMLCLNPLSFFSLPWHPTLHHETWISPQLVWFCLVSFCPTYGIFQYCHV